MSLRFVTRKLESQTLAEREEEEELKLEMAPQRHQVEY